VNSLPGMFYPTESQRHHMPILVEDQSHRGQKTVDYSSMNRDCRQSTILKIELERIDPREYHD
jgi:hypothetical protein